MFKSICIFSGHANPALAESTMVRHLHNQMETLRKAIDTVKGENR